MRWLLILALVGCSSDVEVSEGFVVSKRHRGTYTTTVCHSAGKALICTPLVHPERFTVLLASESGEEWHSVPESRWETVRLGEWFCVDERLRCEAPQ